MAGSSSSSTSPPPSARWPSPWPARWASPSPDLIVLTGYDDDLNQQSTRLNNRLRDALLHVYPGLERLLGRHIDRGGVIDLLAAAGTPDAIAALGHDGIAQLLRPRSPRLAKTLPAKILATLAEQAVVVPGT